MTTMMSCGRRELRETKKEKIKDTTAAQKAHFLEQIAVPEATITVLTGRERENNTRRDVR